MMFTKKSLKIKVRRLFDGLAFQDNVVLEVKEGIIHDIHQYWSNFDLELESLVVPGFVDLQVNGGGGVLFNESPSIDSLEIIAATHAKFGTTGLLPTIITDNVETMDKAADAIAQALQQQMPGILGIHFEGPHIAVDKKGAHCEKYIRPISDQEWKVFSRKDIGKIVVTLAPECVPVEDIKRLVSLGVLVSLGHSNAGFREVDVAIKAGAKGFTHLFNAMSPLGSREPGVVGTALVDDSAMCGLIVDGHHVSIPSCKLALKAKTKGGVFLVTDAMPPVGVSVNEFSLLDKTVHLESGKLTSTTGELAGSVLNMASAVSNCIQMLGLSLEESIRMASLYPLLFLSGKHTLPIFPQALLKKGAQASFVHVTSDMKVLSTWIDGKERYNNQSAQHRVGD